VLRATGRLGDRPELEAWENAVQQSVKQQTDLLNDWSDMADFEKLSVKEATKLSDQIVRAMDKSIETQNRLWTHWLNELLSPEPGADQPVATKPKRKQKAAAVKNKRSLGATAQSGDNLKQISGIGPALEKKLKENGISTFKQLAELRKEDIAHLEEQVIRFPGRIKREQWVQQAKKLIP
jgi:large subunit ribosomal protein L21